MKIYLRYFYLLFLGILAFTLLCACSKNVADNSTGLNYRTEDCRVVQHAMGETCIPHNPQRVITLWMSTFSSALALGIKPIAYTWVSGEPFPEHLQDKANEDEVQFLGSLDQPNLERILWLKPDLILSNTQLQNIYKPLSKIAPTVVLDYPSPPPLWQKHLEDVAKLFDKEKESKQLVDKYWQRIDDLKKALGSRRQQIKISVVRFDSSYGIVVYGKEHPVGTILNDIGLQRPSAQNGNFDIKNISQERLSDIDGDVIFLSTFGGEATKSSLEKLKKEPLWQQLNAVQKNQVYLVDFSHWYAFDVLAMNAVIDDLFRYLIHETFITH
jgi:iron complex transport system substrate-binding protein